jgi:hypothetical protein
MNLTSTSVGFKNKIPLFIPNSDHFYSFKVGQKALAMPRNQFSFEIIFSGLS